MVNFRGGGAGGGGGGGGWAILAPAEPLVFFNTFEEKSFEEMNNAKRQVRFGSNSAYDLQNRICYEDEEDRRLEDSKFIALRYLIFSFSGLLDTCTSTRELKSMTFISRSVIKQQHNDLYLFKLRGFYDCCCFYDRYNFAGIKSWL